MRLSIIKQLAVLRTVKHDKVHAVGPSLGIIISRGGSGERWRNNASVRTIRRPPACSFQLNYVMKH